MKYSNIALEIVAAREYGVIKSNAQFWKEFSNREKFEDRISENINIKKFIDKLSDEFDSSESDGGFVCIYDDEFPVISRRVKNNSEKPYLLFYKGDLSLLKDINKNIAIIGLLDPDEEIIKRESEVVQRFVENELVIISGLALGCDTIAHKVCLNVPGKTIAILPTPINKIYPSENCNLAEEIVDKGGLLLTEYYKNPKYRNESIQRFIERDRLQAMFAKAVILVASYRKGEGDSGSRHAVEAAKKYEIERYAMYNSKTDYSNIRFGLNKDLIESKTGENVKVLNISSIEYIASFKSPDLVKNLDMDIHNQLTLF